MLTIYEQLFLLSIHEEKGHMIPSVGDSLGYGLSGAILSEIALLNKIKIEDNHRLTVIDPTPIGEGVIDNALIEIIASKNIRKISYWVKVLNDKPKRLHEILGESLEKKGIVSRDDSKLNWIIPNPEFPETSASAKFMLKEHLRKIIFAGGEPNLRELSLLSLVKASGIMDLVFIKDERRIARQKIYEMTIGMALINPIAQLIEEIELAVDSLVDNDEK